MLHPLQLFLSPLVISRLKTLKPVPSQVTEHDEASHSPQMQGSCSGSSITVGWSSEYHFKEIKL